MPLRLVSGENGTSMTRSKTTSAGIGPRRFGVDRERPWAVEAGPAFSPQEWPRVRQGLRIVVVHAFPLRQGLLRAHCMGRFPDDDARTSSLSDHTRLRPGSKTSVCATQVGNDTTPCAGCASRRVNVSCAAPGMAHGTSSLGGFQRWRRIGKATAAIRAEACRAAMGTIASNVHTNGEIAPNRDRSATVSVRRLGAGRSPGWGREDREDRGGRGTSSRPTIRSVAGDKSGAAVQAAPPCVIHRLSRRRRSPNDLRVASRCQGT